MFLRLRPRNKDQYIMFNMNLVVRVEPGVQAKKEPEWCRLLHLPEHRDENGNSSLSVSEVAMSFDEISMLLSGRFVNDPY